MHSIPILAYHRIVAAVPENDYYAICMQRDVFFEQMETLAREGYRTLSLETASAIMVRGDVPSPKHFVVTFDDGYLDTYTIAAPILRRFGFTATVFVVAGLVGQYSAWDYGKCCTAPLMSWEQIRQLQRWGWSVGSHTLTHPELSQLNEAEARHEIVQSRHLMEARLGTPITTFCYPFGEWNETTYHLVQEAGYSTACNDSWREEHRPFALARRNPNDLSHPLATMATSKDDRPYPIVQ